MSERIASASAVPRHTAAAIATPVPIALESQRPLPLDDATLALRVLSGHVDLFAVEPIDGAGRGQRHHLLRAEAGAVVFALPEVETGSKTPISMIAVEVTISGQLARLCRNGILLVRMTWMMSV